MISPHPKSAPRRAVDCKMFIFHRFYKGFYNIPDILCPTSGGGEVIEMYSFPKGF